MTHNVFANMWEIAAKAGMNKSIARFPDVCLSPPSPPAGPIPIPYPDTSFSKDLQDGSQTVMIAGKPAALAQQSFYKSSPLGDEAATRSFGASVITHQITGKTYFQAWSMDVKFEGKGVCRHIDITTSNHGSPPPGTPPAPSVGSMIPPGLSPDDQKLAEECEKIHQEYDVIKAEQGTNAAEIKRIKTTICNAKGGPSKADPADKTALKAAIDKQNPVLQNLRAKRREYIDKGCDKIHWKNAKHATEAERKAHHEGAVKNLDDQIANMNKMVKDFSL